MAYGKTDFITAHLLDADRLASIREHLPEDTALNPQMATARSCSRTYGSTAGPWGGVGGAALTRFQITTLRQGNLIVAFVDERPFGYCVAAGKPDASDPAEFTDQGWTRFPGAIK